MGGETSMGWGLADVLVAGGRWMMLVGIAVSVGAVSCRLLLAMVGPSVQPVPDRLRRAARLGLAAAWVLLAAILVRLVAQLMSLADPGLSASDWRQLAAAAVIHTNWGHVWLGQIGLTAISGAAFSAAQRGRRAAWVVAAVAAVGLGATPALAGHAIGVDSNRALAVFADILHVLAASTWVGTLFVLASVTLRGIGREPRRPQEWGTDIAGLVRAFSPVALTSATIVTVTGVIAAWEHLDRLSSLWRTDYGRALLIKLSLVALVLAVGAYNWRWVTSRLTGPGGVQRFTRSASVEIALAALVLLATAVLIGLPLPGTE